MLNMIPHPDPEMMLAMKKQFLQNVPGATSVQTSDPTLTFEPCVHRIAQPDGPHCDQTPGALAAVAGAAQPTAGMMPSAEVGWGQFSSPSLHSLLQQSSELPLVIA